MRGSRGRRPPAPLPLELSGELARSEPRERWRGSDEGWIGDSDNYGAWPADVGMGAGRRHGRQRRSPSWAGVAGAPAHGSGAEAEALAAPPPVPGGTLGTGVCGWAQAGGVVGGAGGGASNISVKLAGARSGGDFAAGRSAPASSARLDGRAPSTPAGVPLRRRSRLGRRLAEPGDWVGRAQRAALEPAFECLKPFQHQCDEHRVVLHREDVEHVGPVGGGKPLDQGGRLPRRGPPRTHAPRTARPESRSCAV